MCRPLPLCLSACGDLSFLLPLSLPWVSSSWRGWCSLCVFHSSCSSRRFLSRCVLTHAPITHLRLKGLLFPVTLKASIGISAILFFLFFTFMLLGIAQFHNSIPIQKAAGAFGLITAL